MFKKNSTYILILVILAILSHINWFNPISIINFSDWLYFPNRAVSELWYSWGTWISFWQVGSPNLQISFLPFKLIWSLVTNLGSTYDIAAKITFFIPIAFMGFISPYLLGKKLFKNVSLAFIIALYYGSTTYFLIKQIAHLPIAFVYALTPLVLLFFIQANEKKNIKYWFIFTLSLSLITWYEIRITLLVLVILSIYFIIFHLYEFKKLWGYIIGAILLYLALNSFWIIPTMFTPVISSISNLTSRGLFGDFLFDLPHAFTLLEASWTGTLPNMEFIKQKINWIYWIIPIMAILPAIVFKKLKNYDKKLLLFFLILTIFGIILTKQSSHPFSTLYSLLYEHIPLFQFYREASKFYLFTSVGYFGLLGLSIIYIDSVLKNFHMRIPHIRLICGSVLIIISLTNLYPLITQQFGTTFISNPVPKSFKNLNTKLENDSNFYRTVWFSTCCQYVTFSNTHPRIGAQEFISFINATISQIDINTPTAEQYNIFFDNPYADHILSLNAIKYIILPIDDIYDEHRFNKSLVKKIKNNKNLKLSHLSNESLQIFENTFIVPQMYMTSGTLKNKPMTIQYIQYNPISPTRLSFTISSIKNPIYVHFSDRFNPGWKLRIGNFSFFESLTTKNYFLEDSFHIENNVGLNSYLIDPDYIKKNSNKNNYTINNDGSLTIHGTLFYLPQSYFYAGLFVSGITFLLCLLFFGYSFWKSYANKN